MKIKFDKKLHLVICIIICVASGLAAVRYFEKDYYFFFGFLVAFIAGLSKELIWDKWWKRGTPDIEDLLYSVLGGAIGLTILSIIL